MIPSSCRAGECLMRGCDHQSGSLFSYVDLENRIRSDHPLRTIRRLVDDALASLDRAFADLYAALGRPSIPPERLLRAMLLQAFYSIRSERLLMERLDYDLLFRWFVGLGIDDAVWDPSTFSKNRDRLLEGDIAAQFLTAVLALPRVRRLLSHEHFSVDGTLIKAWASMKKMAVIPVSRIRPRGAILKSTSGASGARMRPTPAPPTRRRGSTARVMAWKPSSASWATP